VLFEHPKGAYAAAICYESVFPDIMRDFAVHGARFFVNITNDGWYGFSSGPTQHALIAAFRAIESRRPIARSANTGISTMIDRAGRLISPTRQYVPDVLIADLDLGPGGEVTFFMRHGMLLGKVCTWITMLALAAALVYNVRGRFTGRS
jgi:apolipoprotein N-acyltransferase